MKEFEVFAARNPECHRIRRLLDDFLAQELSVESSQEILSHLETCEGCRNEKRVRQRLRAQLKDEWTAPVAPPGLKLRIERGIDSPLRQFSGASMLRIAAAAMVPLLAFLLYVAMSDDRDDGHRLTGRMVNHFHLAASDHQDCQGTPIEGKGVLQAALPELERLLNGNEDPFRFAIVGDCYVADAHFIHYTFAGESGRKFSVFLEERKPDEGLPPELFLLHVSGTPVYGTQSERHSIVCLQGNDYYVYLVGDDFGEMEMRELAGKLAPSLQAAVL